MRSAQSASARPGLFRRGPWRTLLLLGACLALGCASAPQRGADSVRAALDGFLAALNALDVDRIASYLAEDVTAFVPTAQGPRLDGKAALTEVFRAYCEKTRETGSRTNIVPEHLTVEQAGSIGIVTFEVPSPASIARRTFVFRKHSGRWLISHFHASNFGLD